MSNIGTALVQWLWETIRIQEIVGSNPGTGYWMYIFTLICCKFVFLFEQTENKQKEAGNDSFYVKYIGSVLVLW